MNLLPYFDTLLIDILTGHTVLLNQLVYFKNLNLNQNEKHWQNI